MVDPSSGHSETPRRTRHVFHNAAAPASRTHRLVVVTTHHCSDDDVPSGGGDSSSNASQRSLTLTLTLSMQAAKQPIPPAVLAKSQTMHLLLQFFTDVSGGELRGFVPAGHPMR